MLLALSERYAIERELGRGGMSVVYLARDRQLLEKRVVIKVLLDKSSLDPWIRQKFLQEMEALSRIDHPGVVGVLDTGVTAEGRQFLVMQYIEGRTLRSVMEPGGMNHARAAGLIRQIAQALAAAHEKGVWHRDLKPENIMVQSLGGEEHVKLIDFGIAGIQDSRFTGEATKVAGSVAYMAPEQFDGHPTAASDTYALGVVAYEILAGKRPAGSAELGPDLSEPVRRSLLKAMSFHQEQRHADTREFGEEIYHALTGGERARRSTAPGSIEMAHVLFTDLVGYSLLPMDQQKEYLGQLQQIVRESPQFRAAEAVGDIISLPTGDGTALAFFGDPTAPAQCALEVAARLKDKPHLKLRMGIHSGPVYRVADVNANANLAGGGINMAQRVMDCGDAGHILVSKTTADVLLQLSQWSPYLTDLGEYTVKHGVRVQLCNLATADLGNLERPRKLAAAPSRARSRAPLAAAVALVSIVAGGTLWFGGIGRSLHPVGNDRSIAVLPFEYLSPEKDQEYFSWGLAEELLDELAKIPELRVAARASSFLLGGKREDPRVIGKKLNVAYVIEGSVRKQGNRAKISIQMIQASSGFNVWNDTYLKQMDDIFAAQEGIAHAVAGALNVKLLGRKTLPAAKSSNQEAHNAYLRGRYFLGLGSRSKDDLQKTFGYFEQATRLDPGFAPAWVGLAETRSQQAGTGGEFPLEISYQQARDAAKHALELDPNSGEAYSAIGWIQMQYDWDWAGADASFQRALVLAPGNANVISHAAILARKIGHLDQAMALGRQAMQMDPLSYGNHYNAGVTLYYAGQYEDAAAAFRKASEINPEAYLPHVFQGMVYLAQGQPENALAEMEKVKHPRFRAFGLALAFHKLGLKKESDANFEKLLEKINGGRPLYLIAEVYAFRGQTDRAFEFLEQEYTEHSAALSQLKGDPLLASLTRDPRYAELLKKVRLPL